MPYCRNCGKEIAAEAAVCPACGVPPPKGIKFCQNCGAGVNELAEICVKCGAKLATVAPVTAGGGKNKVASILLAVFLSYWTWLYTYKRDKVKFWVGLGVSLVLFIIVFAIMFSTISALSAFATEDEVFNAIFASVGATTALSLISTGIWVWAIVDAAIKNQDWYRNY